MSPEDKASDASSEYDEYVTAVVARNRGEAEQYRDLLSDHDIPAVVDEEELDKTEESASRSKGIVRGVQVLVPEVLLDEASEVIADREEAEDFGVDSEEAISDKDDDEDLGLDTEINPDEGDALFLDDDEDGHDDEPFEDDVDDDDEF